MRFGILGGVAAWQPDGSPVPLNRPKVRALLTLLALDPGKVVSTDRLIEGMYGAEPPRHSANALQAQVSRLRGQLGPGADLVERHGEGYRLAVASENVDAYEFERRVADGRSALAAHEHTRAAAVFNAALDLWRGPAIADIADSPVVRDSVTRLGELRLEAYELLGEADIARGELSAAVSRLRALTATHPLRESLWRVLIRALAASGRRAEALAAFEEARVLMADELGTDPSPALSAVHVAVLREDDEPDPVSPGRGLPAQLTRLVGRETELARLAGMIADERLVTVTGPGGAGKTRLAIEAARRSELDTYFVELAGVADPAEVPAAVCSALGIRSYGTSGEISERLTNVLGRRSLLLLLDNCEHVVQAAATACARLVADCASLRVLVTSREPLGVTGETLCAVQPLAVPAIGTDPDTAASYPAVRLFADRVAASDPGFKVDSATCADVITISRALDGMPLAIELAAARVRTLPLGEIAAHLHDPFALLSRGDRTKDERHQTLRSVVEWSWSLLEEAERDLAGRLSVFTGGWTLDAARTVCGRTDAERLLAGLVDKSLVELRGDRYGMLETIRAYAVERLAETGQPDRWHSAHAEYFLRLAEHADPRLRTADQLDWLRRLDADYANLRAAVHWAAESDPSMALQLTSALSTYWWLRGLKYEAATVGRAVAEGVGTQPPEGVTEEYVLTVFNAAADIADPEVLRSRLDGVNQMTQDLAAPLRQPILVVLWAWLSGPTAGTEDALRPPTTALLDSDPWGRALHPMSDGLQQVHRGEPVAAEASFAAALERFRALGERWGLFQTLDELSRFCSWRGEHQRAIDLLDEAVGLAGELGAALDVSAMLTRRSLYRTRAGDMANAHADARRSLDTALETGPPEAIARARAALADVTRLDGDAPTAAALARHALDECPTGWLRPAEERLYVQLVAGHTALAEGRRDDAAAHHLDVLAADDALMTSAALEGLAAVTAGGRGGVRAAWLLGAAEAVRGARTVGDPDVERTVAAARTSVGTATFDAEYDAARALGRGEVLTHARQDWGQPPQ